MQLKEPVRCIHTDPKSKKTTVKFLMPHVAERMRKYGWRVEHVAKPAEQAVEEANKDIPESVPEVTGIIAGETEHEIPPVEFIENAEPVTKEEPSGEVEEAPAAKRKYTKAAPTKVTSK